MYFINGKSVLFLLVLMLPLCSSWADREQKCVLYLCGPPRDNSSIYLNSFNIGRFVLTNKLGNLHRIEQRVRDAVEKDFASATELALRERILKEKHMEEQVAYCRSIFAMSALEEYEQEAIVAIFSRVEEAFTKSVLPRFSLATQNAWANYVANSLKIEVGDSKKIGRHLMFAMNQQMEEGLGEFPTHYCPGYGQLSQAGFEPMDDFAKGLISVSLFSYSYPHLAPGIISHELAHALSSLFLKGQISGDSLAFYRRLRSCVSNPSHGHGENNEIYHPGDTFRTEEDLADLISYLAYPNSKFLYTCSFLLPTPDGKAYQREYFSVEEQPSEDTHSPTIIRIIREATYKGITIPSSCQSVVDEYREEYPIHQCNI